jgi:hypothetical protein
MKYNFPNSDVRYAKIVQQDKNANLDESYSDLDLGFLHPNWTRTLISEFPRIKRASRTLLSPINIPLSHTIPWGNFRQSWGVELETTSRSDFWVFLFLFF